MGHPMPYFRLGNSDCYYEVHGEGEPLLYLHGWNGNMGGFRENLVPDLAKGFQCIAVDLPGFGKSQPAELSFDNLSQGVDSLLDHLKIKSVTLLGFCMGGVIALDYAMRQQRRVNKLVLIETYADFPWFLAPLLSKKYGHRIFEFALRHPLGVFLVKKYLLMRDTLYRDDFFKTFQLANPKISLEYIRMLWRYAQEDHFERMRQMNLKTLLLFGQETHQGVKRSIAKIQRHIRGSRIEALDNAGHFPIEENGARVLEKLRQFLSQ